ncbi:hypothetical protein [Kocuria sp. HSID16901]|uniref:hypothetical protein n=1 Tax=Kocuria sp. HSID16901 TaxID=2419505 RepID=UPI000B1CDD3E|nr:hypothetical protein [Kocuria sp. HSID16901]
MEHTGLRRRSIIKGGAWSAPVIVATAAMPAQAASPTNPDLGVLFDGGGGADGYLNSVYVDLGVPATGTPMTLQAPLVMTLNVEGLLTAATDERAFTVSASLGSVSRGAYNVSTRTTTITWTLPAGTKLPKVSTASGVPDILFTFQDGESKTTTGRIKNKIVITSVTGGTIVTPSSTPIDSSVVRDVNQGAASPNGIY